MESASGISYTVQSVMIEAQKRELEIERLLNTIIDPCSIASGVPIGLVEMGIVESVHVQADVVAITLLPTFPGCIYTAVFSDEITRTLAELDWPREVKIDLQAEGAIWDEERMSPAARERLRTVRAERRRRALLSRNS
jgi:metal-sulfur cluster biosynthetic enzyme